MRSQLKSPALKLTDIDADTPLQLELAAKLGFPDGSMTVSGLRKESRVVGLSSSVLLAKITRH